MVPVTCCERRQGCPLLEDHRQGGRQPTPRRVAASHSVPRWRDLATEHDLAITPAQHTPCFTSTCTDATDRRCARPPAHVDRLRLRNHGHLADSVTLRRGRECYPARGSHSSHMAVSCPTSAAGFGLGRIGVDVPPFEHDTSVVAWSLGAHESLMPRAELGVAVGPLCVLPSVRPHSAPAPPPPPHIHPLRIAADAE